MKLVLLTLLVIIQQTASASPIDYSHQPQASDSDAKRIEAKIADALRGIGSVNSATITSGVPGFNDSGPSFNSSQFNRSLNASSLNSSALNSSGYGGGLEASMVAGGTTAAPQEMGTSTQGASNGFWGIQANKHVMGQSDIKSKLMMSGSFEVDKTVAFSDRGY